MWEIIGQEILIAHESDHIPVRLVLQACFSNVLPVSMPDYRVPSRSCLLRTAEYRPSESDLWEDFSGEVDWDTLPEIPDRCTTTEPQFSMSTRASFTSSVWRSFRYLQLRFIIAEAPTNN
ncbi:hypothetical protein N7536_010733 [Penicillium majusculum]|nr:hypothetical protein N7536_010733 [Penicillium majusculum]